MNAIKKKIWKYRWSLIKFSKKLGFNPKIRLSTPSAFISGSIGKTTTCRMLAWILNQAGYRVALSTSQGTFIDNKTIRVGDSSNCKYASYLLLDKALQACVFELARGGLIDQGVVFDSCDVSAVLNVHDNHIGLNGISTRNEMAEVKSLVAAAAKQWVALNADDPLVLGLSTKVKARHICLISMQPDNPSVAAHLLNDGYAVFSDNAAPPIIKFYKGSSLLGKITSSLIPATLNGDFKPAIHNAMFAMSLACGLGIKFDVIREALINFVSDERTNPGRMNFFSYFPFKLLITFVDGPEAMRALTEYIRKQSVKGNKLLMIAGAGDRPDNFLYDTGKNAACGFDQFICTDNYRDPRGRPLMQAAQLIAQGLMSYQIAPELITIIPSHDEALRTAFSMAREGDFLVIASFYGLNARKLGLLDGKESVAPL